MDSKAASSVITHFAAKFVNELPKDQSVVSSPLSVEFVLALLALGATEPARSELLAALAMQDDQTIRDSFSVVSEKLKSIKGVTLNVANRVYLKDGPYTLLPSLEQDAIEVFNAGIEKTIFTDSAAANAAKRINEWVENQTNEKIKDIFTPDSFDEDTQLVLVNALYFKGSWKLKFRPGYTKNRPFHLDTNTTVEVPMMFQTDDFKFGMSRSLNAQILEMPYEGEESCLVIVLPNEIEGLKGVMMKLAAGHDLMADLKELRERNVRVTVPKFKIETEIDLTSVLPKLGIKSIFNKNNSGLDNLTDPSQSLFVSKAVQKAFIEVNEEGTEAAAATGLLIQKCCMPPSFTADRPFLYLLLADSASDPHVLFTGVYRN